MHPVFLGLWRLCGKSAQKRTSGVATCYTAKARSVEPLRWGRCGVQQTTVTRAPGRPRLCVRMPADGFFCAGDTRKAGDPTACWAELGKARRKVVAYAQATLGFSDLSRLACRRADGVGCFQSTRIICCRIGPAVVAPRQGGGMKGQGTATGNVNISAHLANSARSLPREQPTPPNTC